MIKSSELRVSGFCISGNKTALEKQRTRRPNSKGGEDAFSQHRPLAERNETRKRQHHCPKRTETTLANRKKKIWKHSTQTYNDKTITTFNATILKTSQQAFSFHFLSLLTKPFLLTPTALSALLRYNFLR